MSFRDGSSNELENIPKQESKPLSRAARLLSLPSDESIDWESESFKAAGTCTASTSNQSMIHSELSFLDEMNTRKVGSYLITEEMMKSDRSLSVNSKEAQDLKKSSINNPKSLLGWQIILLGEDREYISIVIVTGFKKSYKLKTKFKVSTLTEDKWVKLKRQDKKVGFNFQPLRHIDTFKIQKKHLSRAAKILSSFNDSTDSMDNLLNSSSLSSILEFSSTSSTSEDIESRKVDGFIVTKDMMKKNKKTKINQLEALKIKELSSKDKNILIGWQVYLIDESGENLGFGLLTGVRKNVYRKTEYRLSTLFEDKWVKLQRKNDEIGLNFELSHKVQTNQL